MSIFKAYDIRGIVPDQLHADLARKIGLAYAQFIRGVVEKTTAKTEAPDVVLGRDARPSGDDLVPALTAGLTRGGCNVVQIGQCTTPMLYFAVGSLGLDGGIMATASHNPPQYNGFKFTREDAIPISYETGIDRFEKAVSSGALQEVEPGGTVREEDIREAYHEFVTGFLREPEKKKLKVAVDTANGMGGLYSQLLNKLNIEVVPLYLEIDCTFPNHEANPLKYDTLDKLVETVKSEGCDLGIGFDGDADRAVAVDETGGIVRSDIMTALIGREMLEREKGSAILYDLRSSRIVPEMIEKLGGRPIRARVGHSFAKALMRKEKAIFGGELSGHCYFRDCYQSDSAIVTVVEILNMIRHHDKPLSELVQPLMVYHSTGEVNFEVEDKDGLMKELEAKYGPDGEGGKSDWLDGVTVEFDTWWFNVRPSNTEPLLRLTLEAETEDAKQARYDELKAMLGTPV